MSEEDETSKFDELVKKLEEAIRKEERKLYGEKTIVEALNPKNVGELEKPDGAARLTDPHGDTLEIHLKVEGDIIKDSKFTTDGRGPTVACGSVITEMVKGKSIKEAAKIEDKDILSVLGSLPEEDLYSPVLTVDTLRAALKAYQKKQ
jgi:NifU-like protein involved in Fe-S cluster formation